MTDVKRLLEQATPLPWSADGWHVYVGAGMQKRDLMQAFPDNTPDAALAVHAVNTLPAYEAAVEALEALVDAVTDNGHEDSIGRPYDIARQVLRRVRGEAVPS